MTFEDIITRNKIGITAAFSGDYRLILNKVHEKELITLREYNNLKDINKENVEGHVVELVDKILNKRDEDICKRFLNLLQTDDDIKRAFPSLGKLPLGGHIPLSPPVQASSSHSDVKPPEIRIKKEEFYELKSQPMGLCLIISNENFQDGSVRSGSNQDSVSLAKDFSWLGFDVVMCKDHTKSGMEEVLKCFASLGDPTQQRPSWGFTVEKWFGDSFITQPDPQQHLRHGDVFVCCVLSHGEQNTVSGIDLEPLSIKTITTTFKVTKQSALTGKPKVFLIQTCLSEPEQPEGSTCQVEPEMPEGLQKDLEADDPGPKSLPERSDLLVVHATIDHEAKNVHMTDGSQFVQSLSRLLQEGCPRGVKITKILQDVNKDISKETSEFTSTLRKELVLSTQKK